jgi:hypothetical protein
MTGERRLGEEYEWAEPERNRQDFGRDVGGYRQRESIRRRRVLELWFVLRESGSAEDYDVV